MNDTDSQHDHSDAPAPLDVFEQQWADQLAQREPDLVQSEEAFVQAVMQQAKPCAKAMHAPAVIGRIGKTALPYAVAAALLFAAFIGWGILTSETDNTPNQPDIAKQPAAPTQPDSDPPVVTPDRPKVALGTLIANAKITATDPANTLTNTVGALPDTLNIDRLFDLLGDSVPDLKEILTPAKPNNEQSRA